MCIVADFLNDAVIRDVDIHLHVCFSLAPLLLSSCPPVPSSDSSTLLFSFCDTFLPSNSGAGGVPVHVVCVLHEAVVRRRRAVEDELRERVQGAGHHWPHPQPPWQGGFEGRKMTYKKGEK